MRVHGSQGRGGSTPPDCTMSLEGLPDSRRRDPLGKRTRVKPLGVRPSHLPLLSIGSPDGVPSTGRNRTGCVGSTPTEPASSMPASSTAVRTGAFQASEPGSNPGVGTVFNKCVAQLAERRSPKSMVGGSIPSALAFPSPG